MNRPSHFFNIESAAQLFHLLKKVASRLATSDDKRTEDLLLLVFGLTHLREWIAPDYDWKCAPTTPKEHFFQNIYKLDEFKFLQGLCNRTKHMSVTNKAMGALYIKDPASNPDSVSKPGGRRLRGYFSNGKDVEEVILAVIKFYGDNWFEKDGNC